MRQRAFVARSVARVAWTAALSTTGSRVRNTAFEAVVRRNARLSDSTFVASDERSRSEIKR